MQPKDHSKGRARDISIAPVRPPDERCLAWELKRPLLAAGLTVAQIAGIDAISDDAGLVEELAKIPQKVKNELADLTPDMQARFLSVLKFRNGIFVEINKTITAALGANTAAYMMGGLEQSRACIHYLVKVMAVDEMHINITSQQHYLHTLHAQYMAKDSTRLNATLALVAAGRRHVNTHHSQADDSGTSIRKAMWLLQRINIQLANCCEISGEQCAAAILGTTSFTSTLSFRYLYPRAGLASIRGTWEEDDAEEPDGNEYDNPATRDVPDDAPDADSSDDEGEEDVVVRVRQARERLVDQGTESKYGTAPIYATNAGICTPAPLHDSYRLRGAALHKLNWWEYLSCIQIESKTKPLKDGEEETNVRTTTRRSNTRYDFDKSHPLYKTHCQMVRSKLVMPVLGGQRPPKYPGDMTGAPTAAWRRAADDWASYVMVLLKPWHAGVLLEPFDMTWEGVVTWVEENECRPGHPTTFISRYRVFLLSNITNNFRTIYEHKVWSSQVRSHSMLLPMPQINAS